MGRKRYNHQIYSTESDRDRWSLLLSKPLEKIRLAQQLGSVSPAEAVASALQLFLMDLQVPSTGLRAQIQVSGNELPKVLTHRYKGLPEKIQIALEKWMSGEWKLRLFWTEPSPLEVLQMISKGERCVSIFWSPKDLGTLHEEKFDSLGFIVHDLMHAYQFNHNPGSRAGQIEFAQFLLRWIESLEHTHFSKIFLHDPEFIYLMSDMNSHPEHLRLTFLHHCQRLGAMDHLRHFLRGTENVSASEMITNFF